MPPDNTPLLYSWGYCKGRKRKEKTKAKSARISPKKILQGRARPLLIGPYYLPSNKGAKNTASVGL
jgi:hypothetical protein